AGDAAAFALNNELFARVRADPLAAIAPVIDDQALRAAFEADRQRADGFAVDALLAGVFGHQRVDALPFAEPVAHQREMMDAHVGRDPALGLAVPAVPAGVEPAAVLDLKPVGL